jgi:hypothetical protein
MTFDEYELELIEDRVREFCSIMQCLGAEEVRIESIKSKAEDDSSKVNTQISGDASGKIYKAGASLERDKEKSLATSLNQKINLNQHFTPYIKPLPEDLVWYKNEASWQRLYKQRMQGGLLEHREKIETRKSRMVNSNELRQVEAELGNLLLKVHGNYKKTTETKLDIKEDVELTIYVRFASLDDLNQRVSNISPKAIETVNTVQSKKTKTTVKDSFTTDEQEYLTEFKDSLDENGEILANVRRLLNRFRDKLGISEERAVEIEKYVSILAFTEDEKEYYDMIKACFEQDGKISDTERRLLNRLRVKLSISEERATEIENMI